MTFHSDRLFDNLGFMGDFERAQHVLEGTYVFPEGIDPVTAILLEECSKNVLVHIKRESVHI